MAWVDLHIVWQRQKRVMKAPIQVCRVLTRPAR